MDDSEQLHRRKAYPNLGDNPKAATLECTGQLAGGWAMAESPLLSHCCLFSLGEGPVNLVHFSSPARKFCSPPEYYEPSSLEEVAAKPHYNLVVVMVVITVLSLGKVTQRKKMYIISEEK